MIDPKESWKVVDWLQQNSRRRAQAIRAWAFLLAKATPGTGAIPLTRGEIAGELGISPDDLSSIVMELVRYGAIKRQAEGREVSYFMNAPFFTATTGEAPKSKEEEAQEELRPSSEGTRYSVILPQHEREVPSWTPEDAGDHEDTRESDFNAPRRTAADTAASVWAHWRDRLFPDKRKEDD